MNYILSILKILSPWVSKAHHYDELSQRDDTWREREKLLQEQIDRLHPKMSSKIGVCVCLPNEIDGRKLILKVEFEISQLDSPTARQQAIGIILQNAEQELQEFFGVDKSIQIKTASDK